MSMTTIYKYKLEDVYSHYVAHVPSNATIIDIAIQYGKMYIWAIVPLRSRIHVDVEVEIHCVNTGESFDGTGLLYLKTLHVDGLVHHLFQKGDVKCLK